MDSSKTNKAVIASDGSASPVDRSKQRRSNLNRSQSGTALPTLALLAYVTSKSDVVQSTMEFHMTIRTKVSELTPKQASMLLSIAVARAVRIGVDFTLYLAIEFLDNFLKKSGVDILYIKSEKIRQTALLAELVLTSVRGSWLDFLEVEVLPKQVREEILTTGWLPSDRELNSWKQHWELERYLSVQIVPMEHLINRVPSTAERYSGYTRGYGNDGSPPEPGKTRPTPELDGEDFVELPPQLSLQEFEKYQAVLLQIESAKARRRQE